MVASANNYRNKNKSKSGAVAAVITIVILLIAIGVFACNYAYKDNNYVKGVYPREYSEYVETASKKFDVPEPLIYAVIRTESGFDPNAGSGVGALGLMQIMPDTFEWLQGIYPEEAPEMSKEQLYDPETNIMYGTFFLSWLLDRYEEESSAVAAYNAGFGAVDNWLNDSSICPDGVNLKNIPYGETANYVVKVEDAKTEYIALYY